jgi:hypothetical protein
MRSAPVTRNGRKSSCSPAARRRKDGGKPTEDKRTFNLYTYRFTLNSAKVVQSITLPNDSHLAVLAATLLR